MLKARYFSKEKFWTGFGIGYVTDLLDTLGIGTFATTTTMFKLTKLVEDDRKIPATMTTAHIIPVLVEALLFITIVEVDMVTLIAMAAAFTGAFVGAKVTQKWDTKKVQRILGILLIIATCFMVYRMITNPGADLTNEVKGLTGWKLAVGIAFDFMVGMLMSMGLGNYAPELIFFSLMGISPAVALPVMMLNLCYDYDSWCQAVYSIRTSKLVRSSRNHCRWGARCFDSRFLPIKFGY